LSFVTDLPNKLKQLPQAKLSQFVVGALLIYIASILANISWTLLPGEGTGKGTGLTSPKQPAGSSAANNGSSFSINLLTSLNLFGDHQAVAEAFVPVIVTVTEAPETNLNLILTATVAEDAIGKGSAIIAIAGEQSTYGIGDKITKTTALVHQVFTDRVILQVGNRHETLMLDGVEYNSQNDKQTSSGTSGQETPQSADPRHANTSLSNSPSPRADNDNGDEDDSNTRQVDKRNDREFSEKLAKQRDEVMDNPGKLMDFIRVSPVRENGQLTGYRLNPSGDPEFFNQAGLKANDLAVEINGYALNDMQQAMTALQELRQVSEANIVVERDGVRTEILFSMGAMDGNSAEEKKRRDDPDPRSRGGKLNY
jgi:general secretion pathway protein C